MVENRWLRLCIKTEAMIGELMKIAAQCDGVRCNMGMLVLPDVAKKTWDIDAAPFLAEGDPATAQRVPRVLLHGGGVLGP